MHTMSPTLVCKQTASRGRPRLQRATLSVIQKQSKRSLKVWNYNIRVQNRKLSLEHVGLKKDERERVVILGSGWAGYTLARRLDPKKYQPIVVSPRSYFVFTPLLAGTAVGTLEFRTALEPVRSRVTHAGFLQGWADSVDFLHKRINIEEAVDDPRLGLAPTGQKHVEMSTGEAVAVQKGRTFGLDYDKLVIAVGCYSQTFGIPGVREHSLFLKDVGDARRIRKRVIACFENAALPTTSETMKKYLLNFAIVGGGPTGIEFSAELHDLITEDLAKHYPHLMKYYNITVYDVAPTVLPMFDKKLGDYAIKHFAREGISIKTSHHIKKLRRGLPDDVDDAVKTKLDPKDEHFCMTLDIEEEGQVGVGMVVWSTGLMMNPFVKRALGVDQHIMAEDVEAKQIQEETVHEVEWKVKKDPRTGSIVTDDQLRLIVEPKSKLGGEERAVMKDVFALGDCSIIENTSYPATAQVASQKAEYLAKTLNKGVAKDANAPSFRFNNLGVMAYIGNWNAIFQGGAGNVSGRTAWLIWRGAYLTKSVSWRNKILIPMYWFLNWLFGRDISRF